MKLHSKNLKKNLQSTKICHQISLGIMVLGKENAFLL